MSKQSKLDYMKSLRECAGLSQGEFAIAIDGTAISHYETGRTEWGDEVVEEARKTLKDWLFERYSNQISAMDEIAPVNS